MSEPEIRKPGSWWVDRDKGGETVKDKKNLTFKNSLIVLVLCVHTGLVGSIYSKRTVLINVQNSFVTASVLM